jgi:hypothetical protein
LWELEASWREEERKLPIVQKEKVWDKTWTAQREFKGISPIAWNEKRWRRTWKE